MSTTKVLVLYFGNETRFSEEDQRIVSDTLRSKRTLYFSLQPHTIGDFEKIIQHTPEMIDEVLSALSSIRHGFTEGKIVFEDVESFEDIENLIVYFDNTARSDFLDSEELLGHLVPYFAGTLMFKQNRVATLDPDTATSMRKLNQGWLLTRNAKV